MNPSLQDPGRAGGVAAQATLQAGAVTLDPPATYLIVAGAGDLEVTMSSGDSFTMTCADGQFVPGVFTSIGGSGSTTVTSVAYFQRS